MKAAQYSEYGSPDVIRIMELDKPTPTAGQVLVEVKAAAINPFDDKLRQGVSKDYIPLQFPVTAGADLAGVVVMVGSDVADTAVGDEVFGSAIVLNGGSGALAEFAVANQANIAKKPATVNFEEAAALVLVGVSAVQALDQLNLSDGKKILIHGGAGGIGSAAIQYAKNLGAYVATTVRADDKDFVAALGADEIIDYQTQKFEEVISDYDAVFDTVGGETYQRSFAVLKEGGIIISMLEQPNEELMSKYKVTALPMSTKVTSESLTRLAQLIDSGVIKPQIDKIFPLNETAAAFTHLESGHPKGKVVIKVS